MTIKGLHDLKPGDLVAVKGYSSSPWFQDEVLSVTDRCIFVKSEPSIKFKKTNGLPTKKEDGGHQISIVTPAIQEDFDSRAQAIIVREYIAKDAPGVSVETLKDVLITLLSQNEYSKYCYIQCLKEILSVTQLTSSSSSLKQAVAILAEQLSTKD
jgi:hypothetical protein